MGLRTVIPEGFNLGCSEDVRNLQSDELLQQLIVDNFNILSCQNSLKLKRVGANPYSWVFDDFDWLVNFAGNNGLKIRGHLMLWARSIPDWLGEMESHQFRPLIKEYIQETLTRYPSIKVWDICGESYDDNGNQRDTILTALIGKEWVQDALIWAREVRPDATLLYSEFKLHRPRKQNSVLNLVDYCALNSIPLDGIAVQLHHNVLGAFKLFTLNDFIKKLQCKGMKVEFSEVTLWGQKTLNGDVCKTSQAVAYSELLRLSRDCGVTTFNFWGSTDRYAWRNPEKEPFLFDREYQPKLAYYAIKDKLTRFERIVS